MPSPVDVLYVIAEACRWFCVVFFRLLFFSKIENIPNPTADASVGLCVVSPEQSVSVAEVWVGAGGLPVLTPKEDPVSWVGVGRRISGE